MGGGAGAGAAGLYIGRLRVACVADLCNGSHWEAIYRVSRRIGLEGRRYGSHVTGCACSVPWLGSMIEDRYARGLCFFSKVQPGSSSDNMCDQSLNAGSVMDTGGSCVQWGRATQMAQSGLHSN